MNSRSQPQNIIKRFPGNIGAARQAKSATESWDNIFSNEMLQKIVDYTYHYTGCSKKVSNILRGDSTHQNKKKV